MISGMKNIKTICSGEKGKSLLLFLLDGLIINGAYSLTTGVVLSGYLIHLGTSDFLTALLNNSMNYATILSLFSFIIFERMRRRKKLLLTMNFISRALVFSIVLLPLIFHSDGIIFPLLAVMIIASEAIWGIYRIGWTVWMMNIVPKESKSEYFYFRTFLLRLFISLVAIVSGFVLDYFNKGYIGFLIVISFSFVLSLIDLVILDKIEETDYITPGEGQNNLEMFLEPVLDKKYRSFLAFTFCFYLGLTMATSFTPVYLIRYLKLDYKFISIGNVISQVAMMASNIYWADVEKRKGSRLVLGVTAIFTAGELLVLSFLKADTYYLLFLSNIVLGIGMGGFWVSIFTYRFEIIPESGKTVYEGWFYFISGLGMLIAPFAGKVLIDYMPEFTNAVYGNSKIQLLYLISFSLLSLMTFFTYIKPVTKKQLINTNM